jgi:hypothetical protein
MTTRCHPIDGIHKFANHLGTPLNPYASPEERKKSKGAKVLFDCLFPRHWKESDLPIMVSFNKVYSEEIKKKVLDNWTNYGFKD